MYAKVKLLRQRGARRADRDITADPGTIGHITMVRCAGHYELKLHSDDDGSRRAPIVPVLFDAVLVSMDARMLFCGYERQGAQDDRNAPTMMQEWAVEVLFQDPARRQ